MMSKPRVIVSGAGIAGTVLAFWLGKHDYDVTVIERSKSRNIAAQGQIIDVEGPAQTIVTRMGLLDKIKLEVTHEAGGRLVDASDRDLGTIPAGATAASNEIEIMRPALAKVFTEAADQFESVQFRYGCIIDSVTQTATSVKMEIKDIASGAVTQEEFDFLVAADGLRSSTRNVILDPSECDNAIRSVGVYATFFSIPAEPQDKPYARYYIAGSGKGVSTKPLSEKETSCYLMYRTSDQRLRAARESRDVEHQKKVVAESFAGAGWETDRILKEMMNTDNFYFEEISQIFLNKWSKGRCVLLGDTAYAPSPITGQGTKLAIVGAYVLAHEILQYPENPEAAFEAYDKAFRPYVNKTQPLLFGGRILYLTLPGTWLGYWIARTLAMLLLWLQVWKYLPEVFSEPYDLPDL